MASLFAVQQNLPMLSVQSALLGIGVYAVLLLPLFPMMHSALRRRLRG